MLQHFSLKSVHYCSLSIFQSVLTLTIT